MTPLRHLRRATWALAFCAFGGTPATAATVEAGGVRFDDAVQVQGQPLLLNGAGVRYKAVFKVYAAGLYLPNKAGAATEVLGMPGAKRMRITMLRDIDSSELGKLFIRGVEDNVERGEMKQLVPGLLRMGQIFSDQKKLVTGDTFLIDWLPERGTLITVRGQPQGEPFKEPEFYNALLRIWLGQQPADRALKDSLLGVRANSETAAAQAR